jgi:hypothetical protein
MYPIFFPTLTATPAVTTALGSNPTRVYPHGEAPQGVALPYATHQLVTGSPENYLGNTADMDGYRVQFNCYGATATAARNAAKVIREALEGGAYLVSFNGTGRDPDTNNYTYGFDMEFMAER